MTSTRIFDGIVERRDQVRSGGCKRVKVKVNCNIISILTLDP